MEGDTEGSPADVAFPWDEDIPSQTNRTSTTQDIGGRWMVSIDALEEFFEQTTAAANGEQPKARTNRARAVAISKAEAELAKDGI